MSNVPKNYIYNTTFNILNVIIPLVTAPYLARILGTAGVGVYSYYYSIATYFTLFAKLGLTNYGTRHLACIRDDKDKLAKEFSRLYIMQISITAIVLLIYVVFVIIFADRNSEYAQDRQFKEKFTLKRMTYSKSKKYYLIIKDGQTDLEVDRVEFMIDIAFQDGFDFFTSIIGSRRRKRLRRTGL